MAFMTFHLLGIISPTDELIFFRGVGQPPTSISLGPRKSPNIAEERVRQNWDVHGCEMMQDDIFQIKMIKSYQVSFSSKFQDS